MLPILYVACVSLHQKSVIVYTLFLLSFRLMYQNKVILNRDPGLFSHEELVKLKTSLTIFVFIDPRLQLNDVILEVSFTFFFEHFLCFVIL